MRLASVSRPDFSSGLCLFGLRLMSNVRRHRGIASRNGLVHLEPGGDQLVAYLERRTTWDS